MTVTSSPSGDFLGSESVLHRLTQYSLGASQPLTAFQAQVDGLVSQFGEEATRPQTLAAMVMGGLAYRVGRIGTLALASQVGSAAPLLTVASYGIGLGTEVSAFEATNRLFSTLSGDRSNPNLWNWRGRGGWGEGLFSSALNFGLLKGVGSLAQGSNLILQHTLQSGAMVAGHHLVAHFGGLPRPEGSLAEQWLHAEVTNLQLGAGVSLVHMGVPGALALERSLDLSLRGREISMGEPLGRNPALQGLALAAGGEGGFVPSESQEAPLNGPTILMMEKKDVGGPSTSSTVGSREELTGTAATPVHPVADPTELLQAPFDLREARYHLPVKDEYFRAMVDKGEVDLDALASYARAERRVTEVDDNLETLLLTPMKPAEEYSPGGAAVVGRSRAESPSPYGPSHRRKGILVVTPGRAILGMGSARIVNGRVAARVADPIMSGKVKNFDANMAVRGERQCIECSLTPDQLTLLAGMPKSRAQKQTDLWLAQDFVRQVRAIATRDRYSFINVEDAKGTDLPVILDGLKDLGIAVWSDDKQGTGVIATTSILSWGHLTGRDLSKARGVIFGAGAGGVGVFEELVNNGLKPENIMVTDSGPDKDYSGKPYVLHRDRTDIEDDPFKMRVRGDFPADLSVEEFAKGADFIINLGDASTLTRDPAWTASLIQNLAPNPILLATTNPEPGWTPEMVRQVRPDAYYGSGNQLYENPVNNFCAFTAIGLGSGISEATEVNAAMTVAAARGMFELVKSDWERMPADQRRFHLVPRADDIRLLEAEAGPVARAAARSGVSRITGRAPSPEDLNAFDLRVEDEIAFQRDLVLKKRELTENFGRWYYQRRFGAAYAPFALREGQRTVYDVAPQIDAGHFRYFAGRLNIDSQTWVPLTDAQSRFVPDALTTALTALRRQSEESGQNGAAATAFRELQIITQIASVSPSLGAALALQAHARHQAAAPEATIFHDPEAFTLTLLVIPEAYKTIRAAFPELGN
ncbi:MAG: malic enzyme-like NAD(P)-binding protein [bacterium]